MTELSLNIPQFTVLIAALGMACLTDLRSHRIDNRLTFGCALAGLTLAAVTGGYLGLAYAGAGLVTGLLLFLPGYALGGMGAGDVKLMAAIGAFLGPINVFWAAALTLVIGALFGLGLVAWRGDLMRYLRRTGRTLRVLVFTRNLVYVPPEPGEAAAHRFPYAVAIAAGVGLLLAAPWIGAGGGL